MMGTTVFEIKDNLNLPAEEAYKVLRTNILFCGIKKPIKTLSLTSNMSGEGKTTTSTNLAVSVAKSGKKVLLVDADMRKPASYKYLDDSGIKGLSNLIANNATLDEVINKTNISGLYFIGSGPKPPNAAELVGSSEFSRFVETVREQFDMVIIDTPPLGSVIDSAIIASQTDGSILVIETNSVSYRKVVRMKEQLEKANAKVLGVVLNKMKKSEYKNYYNDYNYYGVSKEHKKSWFKKNKK
jgi:protein-tyrosine kinase